MATAVTEPLTKNIQDCESSLQLIWESGPVFWDTFLILKE